MSNLLLAALLAALNICARGDVGDGYPLVRLLGTAAGDLPDAVVFALLGWALCLPFEDTPGYRSEICAASCILPNKK